MNVRRLLAGLLTTCFIVAAPMLAPTEARAESPKNFMLELRVSPYTPEVDSQFTTGTPYADSFNSNPMWTLGLWLDYQVYQGIGTLGIGGGWSYGWVDGEAIEADSTDETAFNLMPLHIGVVYRFDYLQTEFSVPLVFYAKVGLTWALWWATNGQNEVSNTWSADGTQELTAFSNTFGFFASAGLQIHLDFMSQSLAADFDDEVGVNNSYLFVEIGRQELNDFFSDDSMNLSETQLTFGLMFEF